MHIYQLCLNKRLSEGSGEPSSFKQTRWFYTVQGHTELPLLHIAVMRFTRLQPSEVYAFFFLLPAFSSALDCEQIRTEGTRFNLKPLAGPHSLFVTTEHYPRTVYTNYTLDVCQPLKKAKSKDPKEGSQCKSGTYGTSHCSYPSDLAVLGNNIH